jgi:pimeloyl-ACP methyl ester carboxylesterase
VEIVKKVVTVHGINTDGEWQNKVEGVLKPHFECVHIKYPHYRHLGASQLIFELRVLAIGLAATAAFYFTHRLSTINAWLLCFVTLALARYCASVRRENVVAYFNRELQKHLMPNERPHLIAHSFGTYLTGRTLLKWNNTRFDSIVLTGSVLSHRFRWEKLNCDDRRAIERVRNEQGLKDMVAAAAIAAYGTIPKMGYAGLVGFKGDEKLIHNNKGPYQRCSLCNPKKIALVHNVHLDEIGHSDHFLTIGHAESFWLPFFWGIEPCEYQDWLDLCQKASEAEEEYGLASPDLRRCETWLRTTSWQWCDGETLEQYVHGRTLAHVANLNSRWSEAEIADLEKAAIRLLWKEAEDARNAHHEWLSQYSEGSEASWREKLLHLFQRDSDLQNLRIGVQAGYPELAREREDRIRSLNPKRAVSKVLTHLFG